MKLAAINSFVNLLKNEDVSLSSDDFMEGFSVPSSDTCTGPTKYSNMFRAHGRIQFRVDATVPMLHYIAAGPHGDSWTGVSVCCGAEERVGGHKVQEAAR